MLKKGLTLFQIYKRIGKQHRYFAEKQEAYVFIRGRKYRIKKIRYNNGIWVGFEGELVKEEDQSGSGK